MPGTPRWSGTWVLLAILLSCAGVFLLDCGTGTAPVQHLYYLPIILGAFQFGKRGGIAVALAAIVLYHLANPSLSIRHYRDTDIIQIVLFLVVGIVTAKLVDDSRKLRQLALTDDLTGLHNLRSFESRLRELVHLSRLTNQPLSLVVLDVDHLKRLNDQYGHLAGAEAVRAVGHIIARNLSEQDVACRYGGDEFAIVLPSCDRARSEQVASRLSQAVATAAPFLVGRSWPAGTLSISIGVACRKSSQPAFLTRWETDEREGERLFCAADAALYRAKAAGRNCVRSMHGPA